METEMERHNKNDKGHDIERAGPADAASFSVRGHGEEILLVDDDPIVLETYRRILKRLNYEVITASDGREAVDLYRLRWQQISLVVIDFKLPKLSGRQAIQEIEAINPNAKIIIITGYYGYYKLHPSDTSGMGNSMERVLLKPFSIEKFGKAIEDELKS